MSTDICGLEVRWRSSLTSRSIFKTCTRSRILDDEWDTPILSGRWRNNRQRRFKRTSFGLLESTTDLFYQIHCGDCSLRGLS
jgi:hypothetical protein